MDPIKNNNSTMDTSKDSLINKIKKIRSLIIKQADSETISIDDETIEAKLDTILSELEIDVLTINGQSHNVLNIIQQIIPDISESEDQALESIHQILKSLQAQCLDLQANFIIEAKPKEEEKPIEESSISNNQAQEEEINMQTEDDQNSDQTLDQIALIDQKEEIAPIQDEIIAFINEVHLLIPNIPPYNNEESEEDVKSDLSQILKQIQDEIDTLINSSEEKEEEKKVEETEETKEVDTNIALKELNTYSALYHKKISELKEEDFQKDIELFEASKKQYLLWKSYLVQLNKRFENKLHYPFTELLEKDKYQIKKDKRVLIIPLLDNKEEQTIPLVNKIAAQAQELKTPEDLLSLPAINIRKSGDLDYRLDENIDPSIQLFLKNKINTIVLILKQMEVLRKRLLELLSNAYELEEKIHTPFSQLDTKKLIELMLSNEKNQETKVQEIKTFLSDADQILSENYQKAQEAKATAEQIQKQYFDFLKRTLFRTYDSLNEAKKNFTKEILAFPAQETLLKDWGDLYEHLLVLMKDFLKEQLDIEVLPVERGEEYKDELHNPYMTSEPDKALENNQIKEIINEGFQFNNGTLQTIIKQTDVVVVNND